MNSCCEKFENIIALRGIDKCQCKVCGNMYPTYLYLYLILKHNLSNSITYRNVLSDKK